MSPALGGVGQGRLNTNNNFPPKKIGTNPKQAGKKEGSGGRNFCPPALGEPGKIFKVVISELSKSAFLKLWVELFFYKIA